MIRFNIIAILLFCSFISCNKVDNDLRDQYDQPSISTQSFSLPDGTSVVYPTVVMVGDTITLAGRLNIDQGGVITFGNAKAILVHHSKVDYRYYLTKADYVFDIVRFVVTADMGSGPQDLTVSCKGRMQKGPAITILTQQPTNSRQDTTLIVQQLFDVSMPGFKERYSYLSLPFFEQCMEVTKDGTVFMASTHDIFRFRAGSYETILKKEDLLMIGETPVNVLQFLGAAPDPDNTLLYISLVAELPAATDDFRGAAFLLKMDLATRAITVLNRTTYTDYQFSAYENQKNPAVLIYRGTIENVQLYAKNLKVDAKNRLLFDNEHGDNKTSYTARMAADGTVAPLLESPSGNGSGGMKYEKFACYTQDGLNAFISHEHTSSYPPSTGLMLYDLDNKEAVVYTDASVNYAYSSSEPIPAFKFSLQRGLLYFDYPRKGDFMALSNRELLKVGGPTIGSINPETAVVYAYAGLEIGYSGRTDDYKPEQNKLTGQARYVSFGYVENVTDRCRFIGLDAAGRVYLMRSREYSWYDPSSTAEGSPEIIVIRKP
ncbi:hypothetical protein GFS24_11925 [Chitinophaga sp. SYP-B3965]|uniref:hypothetical protein n=1 Tax=Chitinophaga sp. SYP-B3965 TaxID=2663120 RepID=UPI001299BFE0|nr:hypothetical protein [Chitinophaga sp. SYP-B3965]MRG45827.1 hypothetical protein [Chitinophaga sp. SYP-B3965]